ncbi:bifunctional diguanylate cyclase/phosphodiesterase [Roseicyclus marinus]|uniref:bifunctional diguanylate cyclase/phosphodiesterase n=1 Tax=Roseicyclus marinus TaxID=2161673 RepID=UPI0030C6E931
MTDKTAPSPSGRFSQAQEHGRSWDIAIADGYCRAGTVSPWGAVFKPTITSRPRIVGVAVFVLLGLFAATVVVYETGGTTYPYPYVILLPVILAAAVFKIPGGLVAGLIAALCIGPWMPLDVENEVMQTTQAWVFRLVMFLMIGGFTGLLAMLMYLRQQESVARERIDPVTGLLSPVASIRLIAGADPIEQLPQPPGYAVVVAFEGLSAVLRALGIEASNRAICQIGRALEAAMGPDRLVTRIHGSTFGIALPSGMRSLRDFVEDMEERMPATIPFENFSLLLLPRFGLARLTEEDRLAGHAFRKAMAGLTLARKHGRRVGRYSSSFDMSARRSLVLLSDFERALREEELEVHFQPKVDLATREIMGVEALVRWRDIVSGNIPPSIFVPIVEKTTLIDQMTRYVAQTAIRQLAQWQRQGIELELALNLSPPLLGNPDFMNFLKALPQEYGIDPTRIEIEITENALMENADALLRVLHDLNGSGFRLAIDDFGTGYSSLLYLKNFPISTVKLDQSFVRDLPDNEASAAISAMTAAVCKRMKTRIVAEGIETPESEAFLLEQGFDVGQGFLYSEPLSAKDITDWITAYRANLPIQQPA